jgi:hypothetical protein
MESNSFYHIKFDQRLADIKEEFSTRRIVDEEFEHFFENPTNYIGMELVSLRIAAMAAKL